MRQTLIRALAPWACPAYDRTYHIPDWRDEGMQNVLHLGREVPWFNVGDTLSSTAFFAAGLLRAFILFFGHEPWTHRSSPGTGVPWTCELVLHSHDDLQVGLYSQERTFLENRQTRPNRAPRRSVTWWPGAWAQESEPLRIPVFPSPKWSPREYPTSQGCVGIEQDHT